MISSNDFRPGVVVQLDGDLFAIVESAHVKRGRGSAYVRAKVRNLKTGATTERTFNAGQRVPLIHLDRKVMQFLYTQANQYVFMDQETYEQVTVSPELLGEARGFLKEASDVTVTFYDGRPIGIEVPNTVELVVVEAAPGIRGDTVAGGTKPATVETGVVVHVPFFVEIGDRIRIDTRSGKYLERVK